MCIPPLKVFDVAFPLRFKFCQRHVLLRFLCKFLKQLLLDPGRDRQSLCQHRHFPRWERFMVEDSINLCKVADQRFFVQRNQRGEGDQFFSFASFAKMLCISASIADVDTRPVVSLT